ncbi:MAG: transcriptional initiation protein Tat [Candidatus Eremiobacter antarcticus]|nr:DUF1501 domain-containing protein [Candidatus Eremiobacteraeota bacterium]MBC5807554.1 DUF1501 domain-containing protein [Candidatus Eremiobacteraeota bacterium]PZR61394.1 MAG: transcriptional initiation protein Tat [Candidatus Eremiobacter sp. RRmetagenome_bin22]
MANRKQFIQQSVGAFAGALAIDSIFGRAARAATAVTTPGSTGARSLVVVNLQGGNDGLNTFVPLGDPNYYRLRPTINIPQDQVLRIDSSIGFNPKLAGLKSLFDQHRVAVLQGVHYPNPNLSHFRSTEIWQTGAPDRIIDTGWAGRYLDSPNLPKDNLFKGLAIGPILPKMMVADKTDVPTVDNLKGFGFRNSRDEQAHADKILNGNGNRYPFRSPYLELVQEIERDAHASSLRLPHLVAGYKPGVDYPKTPFAQGLNLAAAVLASDVGTKVIYISLGSFDTHTAQRARQDALLQQFGDGMKAFYADLAAHRIDNRVLTMTFSEFGRRVGENANRGTDHGTAAPMFLIGGGVKGGIYGDHPSLSDLDVGNLKWHTDFRSVYATILERWLGVKSTDVLGSSFRTLNFV